MGAASAMHAIVVRDLSRAFRQKSRLIGGLARRFMWRLLVGTGYNAIARVEGVASYHDFIHPGLIVMATLFGAMLKARPRLGSSSKADGLDAAVRGQTRRRRPGMCHHLTAELRVPPGLSYG